MSEPGAFPSLRGWMTGTPESHPLREMFDALRADDQPTSPRWAILRAFGTCRRPSESARWRPRRRRHGHHRA